MTPPRILIDCDPGIDDALALIYLAGLHLAEEIELVGVTTTAGNVGVAQTASNARYVLDRCGLHNVSVAQGEAGPKNVELTTTPETHGDNGLGYLKHETTVNETEYRKILQTHADQIIVTGPCTNVADHVKDLPRMTVMGGAINYRGNTTPTAEWNFWVDPHAAKQVFADTLQPVTLCSLGVTERMLLTPKRLEKVVDTLGDHPLARELPELVRFYFEFHQAQGEGYRAQIHDLLTCMVALGTVPWRGTETTVDVEAGSELMRGTSAADLRGQWGREANAIVVTEVNIAKAWEEFLRACIFLDEAEKNC